MEFSLIKVTVRYIQYIAYAVVKYVGGFWPIGVFFAGYRSFFFFFFFFFCS